MPRDVSLTSELMRVLSKAHFSRFARDLEEFASEFLENLKLFFLCLLNNNIG